MRLAVCYSFPVGVLPISVMLLSVTMTWILAWLSVGSLCMALSICDLSVAGSEAVVPTGVDAPLPLMEPALVCPMGAVLSPVRLDGGALGVDELLDWEPIPLGELAPVCGVELVVGAVVPPTAVELPVVEPVPVAPVCAPMEPLALLPLA